MIHLNSIELTSFKGVSKLRCDFDDLTVLAGINNSGKTTVLQAIYLLFAALPRIADHGHITHPNPGSRTISLQNTMSPLGLRDTTWLLSSLEPEVTGSVIGVFANGLRVNIGIIRNAPHQFTFELTHSNASNAEDTLRACVRSIAELSASILTPPGDVPTREMMQSFDQYQNLLREGQGAQLWRNSIWWAIQEKGAESFAPIQAQIRNYFPDVGLYLVTAQL